MIGVVVGGSGFLGRELVHQLLRERAIWRHIVVVDIQPFPFDDGDDDDDDDDRIRVVRADVRDLSALKAAFEDATVVFHLASVVHVGLSPHPLIEQVNMGGTANVIEACHATPSVHALVYTSTCDVVFDGTPKVFADESLPYPSAPCSDYVRTKITAERMVRHAAATSTLRTCCLRPTHQYGPHDPHAILQALRSFRMLPLRFGGGDALFDVVYIGNVAHAHILAARALIDDRRHTAVNGNCYFINESQYINFFDFMRPYAVAVGQSVPTVALPYCVVWLLAMLVHMVHAVCPRIDPDFNLQVAWLVCKHFFFTSARARRDFGYTPKYTPAEGEAATVRWLLSKHK